MKKFFILSLILCIPSVQAIEQKYMPYGYIRDDTITPYYTTLTNQYFQKVDGGQIKCDYRSYREQVEIPLDQITNQLKRGETPAMPTPKTSSDEHNLHP